MTVSDDDLREILAERALAQFTRSGLGQIFVPDESRPASCKAFEDLKDIVRDAYELGWRRRGGDATDIDEELTAAHEHAAEDANPSD